MHPPLRLPAQRPDLPPARVAAVIVTWNNKAGVLNLLRTLEDVDDPKPQVFVVDNHSTDGTMEALREAFPHVTGLALPSNLGGTGGFNAGLCAVLDRGGFDYVWLLDNDVEVEPNTLRVLLETLNAFPDAAIAGSHMLRLDEPGRTNEIGASLDRKRGWLILHHHDTPARMHTDEIYDVDYVAAASMLARFSCVRSIGLWDDLFIHYDDVDWCLRMKAAGYRVLACAASRIRHVSGKSKCVTWMHYYNIRNIRYLLNKHGNHGPLHDAAFVLYYLLAAMRQALTGQAYYGHLTARALIDFFDGHMGKAADLPHYAGAPLREGIERLLAGKPRLIYAVEPAARCFMNEEELARATARGTRVVALRFGPSETHPALPPQATRRVEPARPLPRAWFWIRLILFGQRADDLLTDAGPEKGWITMTARRVLFVAGDTCVEAPDLFARLGNALMLPVVWLRVWQAYARFLRSGRKGKAFASQSVSAFKQKLDNPRNTA